MSFKELEQCYKETEPEKFKSFINVVKGVRSSGGMTTFELVNSLGKIADAEEDECRAIEAKGVNMSPQERRRLTKAARLLACCLVLLCETKSKTEARNKALRLIEYLSCAQTTDHGLFGLAVNVCSYAMTSPGFSLTRLELLDSIDLMAYTMSSEAVFDKNNRFDDLVVSGAGSLSVRNGVVSISSVPAWEMSVKAFSGHNGTLAVCSRNVRDERLKASELDEITSLQNFSSTFLLSQEKSAKMRPERKLSELTRGASYTVELTGGNDDMALGCRPLWTDYEGMCEVVSEELVKGLRTEDLVDYIFDNDCVEGAVLEDESEPPLFSIKDSYRRYAKEAAERDCLDRRVYEAKVLKFFKGKSADKDRVILLSDKGYGGLMVDDGTHKVGDIILVYTQSLQTPDKSLFINMMCPTFEYSGTPGRFDENDALINFVVGKNDAVDHLEQKSGEDRAKNSEAGFARRLGAILSYSKESSSIARYRDLISSAFLFNISGDPGLRDRSLAKARYLAQCLRVAEGVDVRDHLEQSPLDENDRRIIKALGCIGRTMDLGEVASLVQEMTDDKERKIARLLLADSLSHSNPDDVKVSQEEIRRKICALLGVGDHFRGDITKGGGKYGKGELADVEFKASYIFSNRDGKPDLFKQGRGQVMEAVCGFMNKDGGTVYVGVNDSGDPLVSETYGLNADISWFRSNFSTVNAMRNRQLGHNVPQPENLDSYCRFLNYEVELYFKPAVRGCVTISPTEDMDAIRITVLPSEFEIAKLYTDNSWENGVAYVRDGEETKPMSRQEQEQRLMKLRRVGKVEQFILTLTEAMDKKKKVILKDYASGNSNSVSDRVVAPINLAYNNENLWAYDIERKACREFRLSRIGSIETDIEDASYTHAYPKAEADVFRWINPDVNYHIKLKMSIAALNCLLEEYSDAKNLPKEELYQVSPERWILNTHLHGLGAVRRFCLGLADEVEILDTEDAPALRSEIREFTEINVRKLL